MKPRAKKGSAAAAVLAPRETPRRTTSRRGLAEPKNDAERQLIGLAAVVGLVRSAELVNAAVLRVRIAFGIDVQPSIARNPK